jgi:hypothetical protein
MFYLSGCLIRQIAVLFIISNFQRSIAMRKNTSLLVICLLSLITIGCSVNPAQMFIASGVNGNGCCDSKTVVVVTRDSNGQTTTVTIPGSSPSPSANATVTTSASVSPSASPIPSASATASPVPSVSPSPTATASPSAALAAS